MLSGELRTVTILNFFYLFWTFDLQGLTKIFNSCYFSEKLIKLKNVIIEKTRQMSDEQHEDFEVAIMNKNYWFSK